MTKSAISTLLLSGLALSSNASPPAGESSAARVPNQKKLPRTPEQRFTAIARRDTQRVQTFSHRRRNK